MFNAKLNDSKIGHCEGIIDNFCARIVQKWKIFVVSIFVVFTVII